MIALFAGPESEHDASFEEHQNSEHNDLSDLEHEADVGVKVRPSQMNMNTDQQVPMATQEQLQGSPSKSSPSDSEDGRKGDIRESCEKDDELVPEKAQAKETEDCAEEASRAGGSNVDVGRVSGRGREGETEKHEPSSTSGSSNVDPASTS